MSRRRASLAPTLFPFLAVLVCTLGTLILLLAMVAQKADQTAAEAARQEASEELDTERAVANQRWLRAELGALRQAQSEVLERRRGELAYLEQRQRQLREELQRLQREIKTAEAPDQDDDRRETISALQDAITEEQAEIAELAEAHRGRQPRVIITAHEGPYGTDRRPIYVECEEDAIVLQPEGVRIELAQLADALGPGNPLDAALRAIRLHWQQNEPNAPAPYPLLVVRPGGIASYAVARKAMASWDEQFGYELVPQEVELAFPNANPTLRREIDGAIAEALVRQRARVASARRPAQDLTTRRRARPVLSAAALAAGGSGVDRSAFGQASLSGGRPPRLDANGSWDPIGSSAKDPTGGDSTGGGAPGDTAPGDTAPGDTASGAAGAASRLANRGDRSSFGGNSFGGAGETLREGSRDDAVHAAGDRTAARLASNRARFGESAAPYGEAAGDASRGGMGATGSGEAAGTDASGDPGAEQATAAPAGPTAAGPSTGTTGSGGPNASGSAARPPSPGADGSAAEGPSGNPGSPSPSSQQAASRSPDWALPENVRRSRGSSIERRIPVVCRRDAFVLGPARRGTAPTVFPLADATTSAAAVELAQAVRERVATWGVALAGGRWEPILWIEVEPGGETRFRQLQALLRGSGLKIEQR